MADLNTDVQHIKGVGDARARALEKLGIRTLRDLISFFPRTAASSIPSPSCPWGKPPAAAP